MFIVTTTPTPRDKWPSSVRSGMRKLGSHNQHEAKMPPLRGLGNGSKRDKRRFHSAENSEEPETLPMQ